MDNSTFEVEESNWVKTTSRTGITMYTCHHKTVDNAHKDYLECIEVAKSCPSGTVTHVYRYRWGMIMCEQTVIGEG